MMFTARMKYLVAIVLDKHVDELTKELLSLGLLHFVKFQDLQTGLEAKVSSVVLSVSTARLQEIRKRIESFLSIVKVYPGVQKQIDLDRLRRVDLEATEKSLNDLADRIQGFRERQKAIQQEILKHEDIKRQVLLFGDLKSGLQAGSQYSFLNFQIGVLAAERLGDFKAEIDAFPSVVLTFREDENAASLLVISMKRDDAQVDALLEKYGFQEAEVIPEMLGAKEEVAAAVEKKISALSAEQETLNTESQAVVAGERDRLLDLWENLRLNELYYRIQSYFSRTSRTVLFSGWVPAARQSAVEQGIRRITGGSFYLEWRSPEGLEKETRRRVNVPVQLKNPKLLSPFQMLVTNFSIPRYSTIDPTPIVAILYLVMFGLMFGDVGQGLVLFIAGLLGALFGKFKKNMKELVKLLVYCGGAAVLGGFAFGSFFGLPGIVPTLWFNFDELVASGSLPPGSPVQSLIQMLVITLYFGIGVIALGLVLNWINLIRSRQWVKLVFERTGIIGGWMYFGGVYTVYRFAQSGFKALPDGAALLLALGLPALLFIGKPVAEFVERKIHRPELPLTPLTPLRFVFEWVVELLEFFSGYLSNTLSFMRVAGLGVAHVALMLAFTKIMEMLNEAGAPAVGAAVYVVGNIFVIALEGLSAGIQSLRLNYYEFFSKYFKGSGEAYRPVSLKGT
ncbi:MAG: ATPase V [Spirochaetales bacterium]|nr:ATPase V [Spirochaetales bacterium]